MDRQMATESYNTDRHVTVSCGHHSDNTMNTFFLSSNILVRRHMAFELRVFHIRQTNSASHEELTGSPIRSLSIV